MPRNRTKLLSDASQPISETKSITRPIQEVLTKAGYFCLRLNSGTIRVGKRYIRLCPAGTSDLVIFPNGRLPIWCECKTRKGKTNPEQLQAQDNFREMVQRLGHKYVRATCLDDVLEGMRP